MWSYYGSKSKIINIYPPPKYGKIIEPFAGSARYALKYWDRDVLLVDKYIGIFMAWEYVINASKKDVFSLPKLKPGDNINDFDISDGEKHLLSFLVNVGNTGRNTMTDRSFGMYDQQIKNIGNNVFKVKHWKINLGSYEEIKNQEATWFIDPPYQFGGHEYKENNKNIDFGSLANWSIDRKGQTIVCENTKADWMDFKPMKEMQGQVHKTTEAIWSNIPTSFDKVQLKLDL